LTVLTDAMRLVEGEDDGDEPPHPSITVRDATIAGLEGIKERGRILVGSVPASH